MTQKGKLIVIEGVDGSGKETQSKKLYQRLKKEGFSVMQISYPRYDKASSEMVKAYLRGDFGDKPQDVSPYIASTFYAMDRYASYKEDYEQFYKAGGIVIADRYTTSNMVHQAGKIQDVKQRKKFLDWLWDYEFHLYGLPIPDLVYFLDIPVTMNQKLMKGRRNKFSGKKKKDIHERDLRYLQRSYKTALSLVDQYHWKRIPCMRAEKLRSIEEIHEEIYEIFINLLRKSD
ncbi:dTMP kinase [Garciella nitratireducens]|uniref:Thymidylate kinase n=1 Tax=Garciella nitratireducens DSM 15102 TaxID=1121911 RepID=A0A1T4P743_9FIRM|nr:thymidylate kinase [Garciella nitratireducens]SJZ87262.1 dTMP kinase [Garciella nitratireducens DSM 15102]